MCGETMRLNAREIRDRIPGLGQSTVRVMREWTCPECEYFEEIEESDI